MHTSYDMFATCEVCGEYREECLLSENGQVLCYNHSKHYAGNKPLATCYLCGGVAPCEKHHVFRRKISTVQVCLCCNCHRALHHDPTLEEKIMAQYVHTHDCSSLVFPLVLYFTQCILSLFLPQNMQKQKPQEH